MPKPNYKIDRNKNRWALPQDPQPPDLRCLRVWIPDDPEYLARFQGHYLALTRQIYWHRDEAHTAKTVAATWLRAYDETFIELVDCSGDIVDMPDGDETCDRYGMDAPFFKYAPIDPYVQDDIPQPYISKPWKVAQGAITLIPGLQAGDIYTDYTVIAGVFTANIFDWMEAIKSGSSLPKFEFTVQGEGEFEITFIGMPQGGYAYIVVDDDYINGDWLDLATVTLEDFDTVQEAIGNAIGSVLSGNFFKEVYYEKQITGMGEHTVSVTMFPAINIPEDLEDIINLIGFGGGVRSINLCGFSEQPDVPQPQIQRNGDNLEWRPNDLAVWTDLGNVKGDPGEDGEDGITPPTPTVSAEDITGGVRVRFDMDADTVPEATFDIFHGMDGVDGTPAPTPVVSISEPTPGNHLIEFDMDGNGTPENGVVISDGADGEDGTGGSGGLNEPITITDQNQICGIVWGISSVFMANQWRTASGMFTLLVNNMPAVVQYINGTTEGNSYIGYNGSGAILGTAYRVIAHEPDAFVASNSALGSWVLNATNQQTFRDELVQYITPPLTVESFRAAAWQLYNNGISGVDANITKILSKTLILMSDEEIETLFAMYIYWTSDSCPEYIPPPELLTDEPAGTVLRVPGDADLCSSLLNGMGVRIDEILQSTGGDERRGITGSIEFDQAWTGTIEFTFGYPEFELYGYTFRCSTGAGGTTQIPVTAWDKNTASVLLNVTTCTVVHFGIDVVDYLNPGNPAYQPAVDFTITEIRFIT